MEFGHGCPPHICSPIFCDSHRVYHCVYPRFTRRLFEDKFRAPTCTRLPIAWTEHQCGSTVCLRGRSIISRRKLALVYELRTQYGN